MRILHIIVGLHGGGAERSLQRLVESHGSGSGFEHAVVSLTDLGVVGAALQAGGVEVLSLGMRSAKSVPAALWRLRAIIKARDPDVVHTWMYHADLIGGIAARLAGNTPVIWSIHTTDMMKGTARSTALVRRLCAVVSRWIPSTIVCVAESARETHARIGYSRRRLLVIPNGVDVDRFRLDRQARNNLRNAQGWSDSETVIGCLARYNFYKDYGNLVRAFGLLADRVANVRCLLVGAGVDGENRELVALIRATGHADRFTLLGERQDVVGCLSAMDVFCLPSRSEGLPGVVAEAMSVGLPCVVTDVGDSARLLGDGGIVVPRENSIALADALARMVAMTPDERGAIGALGMRRVRDRFSMTIMRRRFEELYLGTKVLKSHSEPRLATPRASG